MLQIKLSQAASLKRSLERVLQDLHRDQQENRPTSVTFDTYRDVLYEYEDLFGKTTLEECSYGSRLKFVKPFLREEEK